MFDIGWSEMVLISIVALLVVGPKELPYLMREVAGWVRKAQEITRDIRLSFSAMVNNNELRETRSLLDGASSFQIDGIDDSSYNAHQDMTEFSQQRSRDLSVKSSDNEHQPVDHYFEAASKDSKSSLSPDLDSLKNTDLGSQENVTTQESRLSRKDIDKSQHAAKPD